MILEINVKCLKIKQLGFEQFKMKQSVEGGVCTEMRMRNRMEL